MYDHALDYMAFVGGFMGVCWMFHPPSITGGAQDSCSLPDWEPEAVHEGD